MNLPMMDPVQRNLQLIRMIGEERDRHLPQVIESAERLLEMLATAQQQERFRRIRKNGLIVAVIGLLLFIWPLGVLAMTIQNRDILQAALEVNGRFQVVMTAAVMLLWSACGCALFFGGVYIRKRREWARETIVTVLWIAVAYCILAALLMPVLVFLLDDFPYPVRVLQSIFGVVITAFCLYFLWKPKRYFSSPELVAYCRPGEAASQGAEQPTAPPVSPPSD